MKKTFRQQAIDALRKLGEPIEPNEYCEAKIVALTAELRKAHRRGRDAKRYISCNCNY